MLLVTMSLSACYCEPVNENQVGLKIASGRVTDVVGPGLHQDMSPLTDLIQINTSAITVEWKDPDLVTSDNQPIEVVAAVTFARKKDADTIRFQWSQYNAEAKDDEALKKLVLTKMPAPAKTITAQYSLAQLIGTAPGEGDGRPIVTQKLREILKPELEKIGVDLLDATFQNFQPRQGYLDLLAQKAEVGLQQEISAARTAQLGEQLRQEEAQTKIELEKANRQGQVTAAQNTVYAQSPEAFALEKLRLLKEVLGGKSQFWFVEKGTDLTLILEQAGGDSNVVPVRPQQPAAPAPAASPVPAPAGR